MEQVDVLIVGAGLSGIGAAWHLQKHCPDRSYAIVETRDAIGGTWDLFRYPGIRSDSDMYTLGYHFRPWTGAKAIADGASIRDYIRDTAAEHGIDRHIQFGQRVVSASWSSATATWTVTIETAGEVKQIACAFLYLCSGYYRYDRGHAPDFPGAAAFAGQIVHPQFWPDDLDHAGKRVIVVGSGATAVTLVPELARVATQVTMLQRSPSYVVSRPATDRIATWLRAKLPGGAAYRLTRWKNVLLGMLFFRLARTRPGRTRGRLLAMVRAELGPDYDVATHFTPRYDPWDQRLCLVPDADLFAALREGRAVVATGQIKRFERDGIRLTDGTLLPADLIVTATGLELEAFGGIAFTVDGAARILADELVYRGMMLSNVPNFAFTFGYTNASWTLKADLVARYVCRLLNTMQRRNTRQAMPVADSDLKPEHALTFTSGYIERARHLVPRQGDRRPWRLYQNYVFDLIALRFGSVTTAMQLSHPPDSRISDAR